MDGHYVRCADCDTEHDANQTYQIKPPGEDTFYLCQKCWDRMIGLALMASLR